MARSLLLALVILDARSLDSGAVVRTDVAIVGGGPAGLTLAQELSHVGCRICLLESGGVGSDRGAEWMPPLADGGPLAPTAASRRQLGGNAHLWNTFIDHGRPAARFIPMDDIDFEARDWLPFSGWPLTRADLEPFYRRALAACGVDPGECSPPARRSELDGDGFRTTVEDFVRADVFTRRRPAALTEASNVIVMLHATASTLAMDRSGLAVTGVRAFCESGRSFTVQAKLVVLAAGTVSNTRLLLLSNEIHGAGLGNQHDLVGRYFMDHHRINIGQLVPSDARLVDRAGLYDLRPDRHRYLMGKLTPDPALMRREHLLNSSTLLWPRPSPVVDSAVDAMKQLVRAAPRVRLDRDSLRRLGGVPRAAGYLMGTGLPLAVHQRTLAPTIAGGGWSLSRSGRRRFTSFELVLQSEQTPSPQNRLTLSAARDDTGLPRARITARWSDVDLDSIERTCRLLEAHFLRRAIGCVIPPPSAERPALHNTGGIYHHMGTTRMHRDERRGVVDQDCRVHGISNLFLAGGSVLPTGGYANPSLTIVALAIRLADHLKSEIDAAPVVQSSVASGPAR